MQRRARLIGALFLLTPAACDVATAPAERGARPEVAPRPNILVVLTDDQREEATLQVMPKTRLWFGRRGVRFPNAYASTPLCCPSRASIFTGQYMHNHGLTTNASNALPHDETIQRYLKDMGYRTAIFGKYLNAWHLDDDPPYFDDWAINAKSSKSFVGGVWNVDGRKREVSSYTTRFITRRAKRFMADAENEDDRPWLLFLATNSPHAPYLAERKYRRAPTPEQEETPARAETDLSDKPSYVRGARSKTDNPQRIVADQLRTLMSVDDLVDEVMQSLDRLGERNTLAFFLSDNGFLWGEHGLIGSVLSKNNPYTDSIAVPLLVRWPGHLQNGTSDQRLASTIDVAATILDAAGLSADSGLPLDGRSLLREWSRDALLTEYSETVKSESPAWASIRARRYQYVEYYDDAGDVIFREYYDLRRDPWQLNNMFEDGTNENDPDASALQSRLERMRGCAGSGCP